MAAIDVVRKFEYFKDYNFDHAFDKLTGSLSREVMVEYIRYLTEHKTPFCFCFIDVDNFKTVNDTFGHQAGDKVLSCTARFLIDRVGDKGVVGRFGGDEFMVVFENMTEYKDIWTFGHETNMKIGDIDFGNLKGVSITISMGCSRYPLDADNYEDILALADKALYRGKMKGRNCFIIYLKEKHANINTNVVREKNLTSMHMCAIIFRNFTQSQDLAANTQALFKYLASYFMFDHICLETPKGINLQVIHKLSKNKDFKHIDVSLITKYMSNIGIVCINKLEGHAEDDFGELYKAFTAQNVKSTFCCKISAYGKDYGFIRVDMADAVRIWQRDTMDILVIAANTLGILLHYQNKTLDDLAHMEPAVIGDDEE